ncbi:MAG: tetratricopeptide repeat protein [Candidatus Omnitrophica bacterium]|nr:tetratricopeptide repeat protein [Candidatus Omnitrophota bacterium]
MRTFLIVIVFLLIFSPFSFAGSQGFPANLYSYYLKGLFHLQKGEFENGLDQLEKAKRKDPESVHTRLKMATVLVRLGRTDEAEKILLEAKKIDPENLEISLALIFIYSYSKKDKELEKEYEYLLTKAHELKPEDIGISEYLGQFYFFKEHQSQAIDIYEKIIEQKPDYVDAYFWLGYFYSETSKVEKAIDTWKKGLAINPEHAPILNSLGYTYAEQGLKLDEAEGMIKKALSIEPQNGAYLDSLGWVYYKKGDLAKALKYLQEAITFVKDPDIYAHLGDVFLKIGDKAKAIEFYKKGIEDFPESQDLKLRLEEHDATDTGPKKESNFN